MTDKQRVLASVLLSLAVLAVIGMSLGGVNGQILSEVSYYEEDFSEYNNSSIRLAPDDELQSQHLENQGSWSYNDYSIARDWRHGPDYGSSGTHRATGWAGFDTSKPWLQAEWEGDSTGSVGMYKELDVPDGMDNPALMVEHAHVNQDTRNGDHELAIWDADTNSGYVLTTRRYDSGPGFMASRVRYNGDNIRNNLDKKGNLRDSDRPKWQTSAFEVDPTINDTTLIKAHRMYSNGNDEGQVQIRQVYWVEGSPEAFQTEVNGYQSLSEDDSFGGPDPYPLKLVTDQTAEGEQTSIRSDASTITREYSLDGIKDTRRAYFVFEGESKNPSPVRYTVEAFGQEVSSGAIDGYSSSEETVELDLDTDDVTVTFSSGGQYEIHNVRFTALQETSAGDPLAVNNKPGGITLNPDEGYDRTIGVLIAGLDVTTDTLLFIVMIALTVGFMVFSFTKSVRGQEFAQSLLFGAIIAGIVIVGVVPTMNLATWIFTGDVDRAPLAQPALEAEPPTYYSTEFQDGTKHGWEYDYSRGQGSVRPVSVGEGFDLQFTGTGSTPGIIRHQEHISLGSSLDTGFVQIDGAAESVGGYDSNPHEVTYNVRVYVTEDEKLSDSEKLSTSTNYAESGRSIEYLRNPITEINRVRATVNGSTVDLSNDFTIVDASAGEIRYEGNSTMANDPDLDETLSSPRVYYDTHRNDGQAQDFNNVEPGDVITINKPETSQDIAAVDEVARSFNGETMSNEKLVTFDLDGSYVHTYLIVRSNRGDENPVGKLAAVRVGATTEGGSTE